ncbi:MAG: hypothetical protein ACO2ZE_09945 [Pseudohongiellaceae bacterium]
MNSNKDIVGQIGEVASHALTPKVQQTLTATIHELRNYASMADDRESLIRVKRKSWLDSDGCLRSNLALWWNSGPTTKKRKRKSGTLQTCVLW